MIAVFLPLHLVRETFAMKLEGSSDSLERSLKAYQAVKAPKGSKATNFNCPRAQFHQPPELRSVQGKLTYPVQVVYALNKVDTPKHINFYSRTFNGHLTGATLRVKVGERLIIPISNKLPNNEFRNVTDQNTPHNFNTINMHLHGFEGDPKEDDVFAKIEPGDNLPYEYTIGKSHPAGTMWYHPHKHGATAMHLFSGMTGTIIIEGDEKNGDLNSVPEIAAAQEIVFNICEITPEGYNKGADVSPGQMFEVFDYNSLYSLNADDSIIIVNGVYQPEMAINPGQVVRLRIVNGSARLVMKLFIVNRKGKDGESETIPLHVCALDGITLPEVRVMDSIDLSSGNRADVLVTFPDAGEFDIRAENVDPEFADEDIGVIATVNVKGHQCDMEAYVGKLPAPEELPTIHPDAVSEKRTIVYDVGFSGGPPVLTEFQCTNDFSIGIFFCEQWPSYTMNGKLYDVNRVDQHITVGDTIEWTLNNTSRFGHPHHIHIHPFEVYETSDNKLFGQDFPPPGEIGHQPVWADTVFVPPFGWVKLRQRYPDFPGKFLIHCHILPHEDVGMMQNVLLSLPDGGTSPETPDVEAPESKKQKTSKKGKSQR